MCVLRSRVCNLCSFDFDDCWGKMLVSLCVSQCMFVLWVFCDSNVHCVLFLYALIYTHHMESNMPNCLLKSCKSDFSQLLDNNDVLLEFFQCAEIIHVYDPAPLSEINHYVWLYIEHTYICRYVCCTI